MAWPSVVFVNLAVASLNWSMCSFDVVAMYLRKPLLFLSFSICLSRAYLGKVIMFSIKSADKKETVFRIRRWIV